MRSRAPQWAGRWVLSGIVLGAVLPATGSAQVPVRTFETMTARIKSPGTGWITHDQVRDLVAVAIVDEGRSIVLATPGLPHDGLRWRFRSLDTSDLPQPIVNVALAASGTKLFIQSASVPGAVLDLTRQQQHNSPLQYVAPADVASGAGRNNHSHRLPGQRFVSLHEGSAAVVDDVGKVVMQYRAVAAVRGAIADDGVAIYLRADGTLALCGASASDPGACRDLPGRLEAANTALGARSVRPPGGLESPRFLALTGHGAETRLVDPEREMRPAAPMRRAEGALHASLLLHGMSLPPGGITASVDSLIRESAGTSAGAGEAITDWQFFAVLPNAELYAPVLQFARMETVFPGTFDLLEQLSRNTGAGAGRPDVVTLYDRYLRLDRTARREGCTFYYRTQSTQGSWVLEYWLYYPFDVGGLVSHAHDPEHIFVEVDKLGGAPRRVIGAGHGYMAGNNIYTADRRGAHALRLPLFAIVELGKHATAPDVDRDGHFTPGLDENEYRERAKIWGVRDVIGTINNQLLAFDNTMSIPRQREDAVALATTTALFPGEPDLAGGAATCRLEAIPSERGDERNPLFRLSDWILLPPCHDPSNECAKRHVTAHPDFLDFRTVLKEWSFPQSFLRATYGTGPRRGLHTVGLGYAMDLDQIPVVGMVLPLPGRLGIDGFYWQQDITHPDLDSCLSDCERRTGVGWGLRYEQFLSNLFGIYAATRVYTPPLRDAWITFGPFVEAPIGRRSNVMLQGGLSFRPYASPRFEFRASLGLWKPKTNHVGLRAGSDRRR